MEHRKISDFNAGGPNGSIPLVEYKCGRKYVVAGAGATYCPRCGEEL